MDASTQGGNLQQPQGGSTITKTPPQDGNLTNQKQDGNLQNSGQDSNLDNQLGNVVTDTGNKREGRLSFRQAVDKKVNQELAPLKQQLEEITNRYNELYEKTVPEKEKKEREFERMRLKLEVLENEKKQLLIDRDNEKVHNYIISQLGNECLYKDVLAKTIHDDFEIYEDHIALRDTTQDLKTYFDKLKVDYAGMFKTINVEGNGIPVIKGGNGNSQSSITTTVDDAWNSAIEETKQKTETKR